ncbi:hypothetical protein K437DRAFT_40854 [Tilletiaria anomala UBC 951]|uniref:Uncharacterized protein n=1 Tax=Tilletiaria anomala (strain ATCC 24038 / CBS 436.72 / UBC 951) TaxID=1037660 RepID=A0A066VAS1_TILAU|nr:uncharacterized protein K437DRAFT_40854 [Tilletiaria anomala UBC 951]KDN37373.1 hypothetical protein K437DRAFT_40854 [Tilletiaria anomala UBC 951]
MVMRLNGLQGLTLLVTICFRIAHILLITMLNTHQFHVSSRLGQSRASFKVQLDQSISGTFSLPRSMVPPSSHRLHLQHLLRERTMHSVREYMDVWLMRSITASD